MNSSPTNMISRALDAISLSVLLAIGIVLILMEMEYSLARFVGDDAGYYFNIARNYLLGYGFSFDRINETNGFNPLYEFSLIVAYKLFLGDHPEIASCLRLGAIISYVVFLATCVFFRQILQMFSSAMFEDENTRKLMISSCFLYYVVYICLKGYYGLDAPLVLLGFFLYMTYTVKRGYLRNDIQSVVIEGALIGLLFLARVDNLSFVVIAYAYMGLLCLFRMDCIYSVVARLGITIATVLPYIIWSYQHFPTWVPVSAKLKTSFPVIDLAVSFGAILNKSLTKPDLLGYVAAYVMGFGYSIYLLRCIIKGTVRDIIDRPHLAVLCLLSLYIVGRFTFMLLFSRMDVQGTYLVIALAYIVVVPWHLVSLLRGRFRLDARKMVYALFASIVVASIVIFGVRVQRYFERLSFYTESTLNQVGLAERIQELVPEDEILYGGAYGLVGFLSDRSWMNADGVTNTHEYAEIRRSGDRGRLFEFLKRHGVDYVVVQNPDEFVGSEVIYSQVLKDRKDILVHVAKFNREGSISLERDRGTHDLTPAD
jgi:hypothetical protein